MPSAKRSKASQKKSKAKRSKTKKELRGQDNDGVEFVTGRGGMSVGVGLLDLDADDGDSSSNGGSEDEIVGALMLDGVNGETGKSKPQEGETITLERHERQNASLSSPKSDSNTKPPPRSLFPLPTVDSPLMRSMATSKSPYMRQLYAKRAKAIRAARGEPGPPDEANGTGHLAIRRCAHGHYNPADHRTLGPDAPFQWVQQCPGGRMIQEQMMKLRGISRRCVEGLCWQDEGKEGAERENDAAADDLDSTLDSGDEGNNDQQPASHDPHHATSVDRGAFSPETAGEFCSECIEAIKKRPEQRSTAHPESLANGWALRQGGLMHVPGKACGHPAAHWMQPNCTRFHLVPHSHEEDAVGFSESQPTCRNCFRRFDTEVSLRSVSSEEEGSDLMDESDFESQNSYLSSDHRVMVPIKDMEPDPQAWVLNTPREGASPNYAAIMAIPPAYVDIDMSLETLIELADRVATESLMMTTSAEGKAAEWMVGQFRHQSSSECRNLWAAKALAIAVAHHRMKVETDMQTALLGHVRRFPLKDTVDPAILGRQHKDLAISCIPLERDDKMIMMLHRKDEPGPILIFPSNLSGARFPHGDWILAAAKLPLLSVRSKHILKVLDDYGKRYCEDRGFTNSPSCGWCHCQHGEEASPLFPHKTEARPAKMEYGLFEEKRRTLRRVESYNRGGWHYDTDKSASSTDSGELNDDTLGGPTRRGGHRHRFPSSAPPGFGHGFASLGDGIELADLMSNVLHADGISHGLSLWSIGQGRNTSSHIHRPEILRRMLGGSRWPQDLADTENDPPDGRFEMLDDDAAEVVCETAQEIAFGAPSAKAPVINSAMDKVIRRKKGKRRPRKVNPAPQPEQPSVKDGEQQGLSAFAKYKQKQDRLNRLKRIGQEEERPRPSPAQGVGSMQAWEQECGQRFFTVYEACTAMENSRSLEDLLVNNIPLIAPFATTIPYGHDDSNYGFAAAYGGLQSEGFTVNDIYQSRLQETALKEAAEAWKAQPKARAPVWQRLYDVVLTTNPSFLAPQPKFMASLAQAMETNDELALPSNTFEMLVNALVFEPKVLRGLASSLLDMIRGLDRGFEDHVQLREGWVAGERDRVRAIRNLQWKAILEHSIEGEAASTVREALVLQFHSKQHYMEGDWHHTITTAPELQLATENYRRFCVQHDVEPDVAITALLDIKDLEQHEVLFKSFLKVSSTEPALELSPVEHLPEYRRKHSYDFTNVVERRLEQIKRAARWTGDQTPIRLFSSANGTHRPRKNPSVPSVPLRDTGDTPSRLAEFTLRRRLMRLHGRVAMLDEDSFATFAPVTLLLVMDLLVRYTEDAQRTIRVLLDRCLSSVASDGGRDLSVAALCNVTWGDGEDMMIVGLTTIALLEKILSFKPSDKERPTGPRFMIRKPALMCNDCGQSYKGKTCKLCSERRLQLRALEATQSLVSSDGDDDGEGLSDEGARSPVDPVGRLAEGGTAIDGKPNDISEAIRDVSPVRTAGSEVDHAWLGEQGHSMVSAEASQGSDLNHNSPVESYVIQLAIIGRTVQDGLDVESSELAQTAPAIGGTQVGAPLVPKPRLTDGGTRSDPVATHQREIVEGLSFVAAPITSQWHIGSIPMAPSTSADSFATDSDAAALRTPGPHPALAEPVSRAELADDTEQDQLVARFSLSRAPTPKPNLGALTEKEMHEQDFRVVVDASPRVEFPLGGRHLSIDQVMVAHAVAELEKRPEPAKPARLLRSKRSASFAASSSQVCQYAPLVVEHHPELNLAQHSQDWDTFLAGWQELANARRKQPNAPSTPLPRGGIKMGPPPGLPEPESRDYYLGVEHVLPVSPEVHLAVMTGVDPSDDIQTIPAGPVAVNIRRNTSKANNQIAVGVGQVAKEEDTASGMVATKEAWDRVRFNREALQRERTASAEQQPPSSPGSGAAQSPREGAPKPRRASAGRRKTSSVSSKPYAEIAQVGVAQGTQEALGARAKAPRAKSNRSASAHQQKGNDAAFTGQKGVKLNGSGGRRDNPGRGYAAGRSGGSAGQKSVAGLETW